MPGIVNVIARLSRITGPMPVCMMLMPRERAKITNAPMRPKMAPEAPIERASGSRMITPSEPAASETK